VVLLSRSFWPLTGGPEVMLGRLACGLRARGSAVTVLTACWQPDWPTKFEDRGVVVVRVPPPVGRRWATLAYIARLSRWLQDHRQEFDLVYVSELKHEAFAALFASRRAGFPVLLRAEHAGLEGDCYWQLSARCGRRIKRHCQRAAAVVAATAAIERELIAAGYPRDRLQRISLGVPRAESASSEARAEARAALAQTDPHLTVSGSGPLVVYLGRLLSQAKGLDDLLVAWRQLIDAGSQAVLWIVGEGPDREQLRARAIELDVLGRVAFAGAFDDVDDFLQAADMFVMPARENQASLALLEAMGRGLPIVATATAETETLIDHGRQGWLVPVAAPGALAQGVLHLERNPTLAAELADAARLRVRQEFDLDQVVERHLTLFQQILDRAHTS
jgi:glycosyltransferase involved in cell wall biosynthesis